MEDVKDLVNSFCGLLYIGTRDHKLVVDKCVLMGLQMDMEVFGYNVHSGMWKPGNQKVKNGAADPIEVLDRILAHNREPLQRKRGLYLLEHFDLFLEGRDPHLLTRLRLNSDQNTCRFTVIAMGRLGFPLPEILEDIPQVDVGMGDAEDTEGLVASSQGGLGEEEKRGYAQALSGLTFLQCENLLSLCLAKRGRLDEGFLRQKRLRILFGRAAEFLELVKPVHDLSHVGGMELLRQWVSRRTPHMKREPGASAPKPPKGLLLTGPPGCGKSFVAQCVAGEWDTTLVRLDPSRLFSSLVGRTEQNLARALEAVRALAPVVLWVDEFEKFFPGSPGASSDGGVLSRVLGIFLEFLQSEREGVFVCATTNAVWVLPPEMILPGRFDALFFIDLPCRGEREAIFKVLLERNGLGGSLSVTGPLLDATEGFSGAEMEQALIDAQCEAAEANSNVQQMTLLRAVKNIVPLAETMSEQVSFIREWCGPRARPASATVSSDTGRRATCHTLRQ